MFDRAGLLAAVAAEGRVARVVVAAVEGSAPREAGAAMLVWAGGQSGTIGGGALEWEAVARARAMLARAMLGRTMLGTGGVRVDRMALGPALAQCCGGRVTLVTEVYDQALARAVPQDVVARKLTGDGSAVDGSAVGGAAGDGAAPLAVRRILARARGAGVRPLPTLVQGWFVEPVARIEREVWIWGAGHVGRAVAAVLAPLPGVAVTLLDVAAARFPVPLPEGVRARVAGDLVAVAGEAGAGAEHLVMTFSHALDLALCDALLRQGFGSLGLIGSGTKWARFRARLVALGHAPQAVARIRCPIGEPGLGKHPQAIAVGVAAAVLRGRAAETARGVAL